MNNKIQLKNLINKDKKQLNEGIINSIISKLISFILSSKIKQVDSLIDPNLRRKVAEDATKLKLSIEAYNNNLNKPEVKKSIEEMGSKIEDFYIKDI